VQQPFEIWNIGGTYFHLLLLRVQRIRARTIFALKTPGNSTTVGLSGNITFNNRRGILVHGLSSIGMSLFLVICQQNQLACKPPRKHRAFVKKAPLLLILMQSTSTCSQYQLSTIIPLPSNNYGPFHKATVSGNDFWTFVSPQEVYQVTTLRHRELYATGIEIRPQGLLSLNPFPHEDHRPTSCMYYPTIILVFLFIETCQAVFAYLSASNASADRFLYAVI